MISTAQKHKKFELTPPQILVLGFAAIILLGTILLTLPFSSADGLPTPVLDALFTATSAACVTGLVVVDTGLHWSLFGKIVIIIMIQVGGLGFMTMSTLFAFVLKKRISLKERLILQEAMNQGSMEGIVRLIRKVLVYSLTIELAGAILFAIRWSFDLGVARGIGYGFFHAISFFNNAGFDLFGAVSGPFTGLTSYADDALVNVVSMALIVLGGLGFVVLSDLLEFKQKRRLSLHSKVVLSASGLLIVLGAIVIFAFEYSNTRTLGPLGWDGKVLASFFQSVSPRTAGANSVDMAGLRQASQLFIIILMFIGASPGSTGGGVKTTTFTVLVGAMIAMIRGKEDIVLFRSRLGKDRILKAITLTMLALFLVMIVTMLLSTTEDHSFLMILFEVTSAFGTVGLSMGLTPDLSTFGKVMIALTMFAGRLGPLTLAYALGPKAEKELYRYPEGKITIG
ncbi:TrkH family potassium uptake protein [Paenibacillus filicis]|uniref:TrkH family potassium uptake protein n=1 Tax=Paenibacillus filicis TaxID=669464 RepID=A0ABU9DU87_9BACL